MQMYTEEQVGRILETVAKCSQALNALSDVEYSLAVAALGYMTTRGLQEGCYEAFLKTGEVFVQENFREVACH